MLAGFEAGRGDVAVADAPTDTNRAKAAQAAADVARRFGVREISRRGLDEARAAAGDPSLSLFDVRTPAEYRAGHLDGTRSVPGGQLVAENRLLRREPQRTVVVVDDADGVRARPTAAWLIQLGLPDVGLPAQG